MTDIKPFIQTTLTGLGASVVCAYPRMDAPLPLVVLADEGGGVYAQADGLPYLEEYLVGVDVYAPTREEMEALTLQVDGLLTQAGLRRTLHQDLYDERAYAWRKRLRYRALMQNVTG